MKLFVYGTLKQGNGNHYLLEGAKFLGKAETVQKYVMLNAGFPVCISQPDMGLPITGEVYEFDSMDMLARLDRLESEGQMFVRQEHPVWLPVEPDRPEQTEELVYMYTGHPEYWNGSGCDIGTRWVTNNAKFEWRR